MPAEHENLALYFGSTTFGAPDDLLEPILRTMWGAGKSLAVATQQLTDRDIVEALAAARRRGVAVRVFLERDYLREPHPSFEIWREQGLHEAHRKALSTLYRSNVDVRVDRLGRLMHNNFVVADAGEEDAVVITTSANFTPTGLHRNLEHLLVLRERSVVKAFLDKFVEFWSDSPTQPHPKSPSSLPKGMKVLFEPENDIEGELVKEVKQAARSVTFSVGSFSTGSKVEDALIWAHRQGIRVFGVLDGQEGRHAWSAADTLGQSGVNVFLTEELFLNKLHHKLAIIDDKTVCLGTFNFSVSAAHQNAEVMMILDLGTQGTELVQYAQKEVVRIVEKFSVSSVRLLGG
jgi:phosphatidylserine/phosphatidylglycerophosphate/cardiolipin synthase-like enzyme